jgi:hypothetical protein
MDEHTKVNQEVMKLYYQLDQKYNWIENMFTKPATPTHVIPYIPAVIHPPSVQNRPKLATWQISLIVVGVVIVCIAVIVLIIWKKKHFMR